MAHVVVIGGPMNMAAPAQFSDSNRGLHELDAAYPTAAKILSRIIIGATYVTSLIAASSIMVGASTLTMRTVIWITGNYTTAFLAGIVASAFTNVACSIGIVSAAIFFNQAATDLADRTAVWLTNLASIPHLQQKLLNAKASFGYLTAEKLNNLDDAQLRYITSWMLRCLPAGDIANLQPRVINGLSENTLNDFIVSPEGLRSSEGFNGRASDGEFISGDELNELNRLEIHGLDSEVLNDLPDEELRNLLPHVINNLSRVTLASISPNVILKLSNDTLRNLRPRIFNNFSTDLAPALFSDNRIMSHLSVKPVRWRQGMSTGDIYVPNFVNLVIAGKRSLWVEKNLYPNIPLEIREDPRYAR